jgi:uncharacterized protein YndB with AHSA1/START domain
MVSRQSDIVQKIKIKASSDAVFSALTEEHQLLGWWPTQVEVDLREGGGYRMSFAPFSENTEKGQFLRIIPGQLLKYSAESSDFPHIAREVTIEFRPQGEHTQLVVTETGWKRSNLWEKLHRSGEDSWKLILQDLKVYLESGKDPRSGRKIYTQRSEKTRFGRLAIRQRYLYKVKPKKVFQALTVADQLTRWFLKEAEIEFKSNGRFKMVWNDGSTQECKIIELVVNKKLGLVWPTNGWAGTPNANTQVRFTITSTENEDTILDMEHTGFGLGDNWARYYGTTYSSWTYYLLNLKSVLENGLDLRDEYSESVITDEEPKDKEKQVSDTVEADRI